MSAERLAFERENPPEVRPYHRTEEIVQSNLPAKVETVPLTRGMLEGLGMGWMADRLEAFHGVKAQPDKPWLTIDEAAEFSGLPAFAIKTLLESGLLPGLDIGTAKWGPVGGRWRVKRADLEKLEGTR